MQEKHRDLLFRWFLPLLMAVTILVTHKANTERIRYFLPSVLILAVVFLVVIAMLIIVIRHFKEKMNNEEWLRHNWSKFKWNEPLITCIAGPALEEVQYRAALIISFSVLTLDAWVWIFISSAVFAFVHLFNPGFGLSDFLIKKPGKSESASTESEEKMIEGEEKISIGTKNSFRFASAFVLGIVAAYFGIKYQSLWLCFGIHAGFNLAMPKALFFLGSKIVYLVELAEQRKTPEYAEFASKYRERVEDIISKTREGTFQWSRFVLPKMPNQKLKRKLFPFRIFSASNRGFPIFAVRTKVLGEIYVGDFKIVMGVFPAKPPVKRELLKDLWRAVEESANAQKKG